jgi:hypothetical protein
LDTVVLIHNERDKNVSEVCLWLDIVLDIISFIKKKLNTLWFDDIPHSRCKPLEENILSFLPTMNNSL